jgi:CMP-N,N'-diacetyllegionaminic acid synthase
MDPTCLAVIPARAESKGIPRKNLLPLGGRPLVAWSVSAALDAARIQRVVVSTDSEEIADVAQAAGAEVPFPRPAELAGDGVHAVHVVLHVLRRLRETEGYSPDVVVMLLPTAPLRRAAHIDEALELMLRDNGNAVVSVRALPCYPTNLRHIREGRLVALDPAEEPNAQRQQQEPLYAVNGAIFAARVPVLEAQRTFHVPDALAYVMPAAESVDVNSGEDVEAVLARLAARDDLPARDPAI